MKPEMIAPEVMIDEKVKVVETAGRNPEKVIKKCKETQLKKVSVMWSRWWVLSKNESQGEYDREKWMHMSSGDQEAGMFVIHKCVAVRHAQTAAKMGHRLNEDGLSGSC